MDISRYSIDVQTAMEDLYIGPQAAVLEKIDRLNNEYVIRNDLKLGITPKFRWKPGTYDKVKVILTEEWLQWHKRPSGMSSIFSRERSYTKNRLKEALIEIENILFAFRAENRTFITDPEEIRGNFELFRSTLLSELVNLSEYFPNSSVNIQEDAGFGDAVIETVIPLEDIKINVSVGNRTGEDRHLGLVDYGDIKLRFTMSLCRWFNIIYNQINNNDEVIDSTKIKIDRALLTHHGSYGRRYGQRNFKCEAEIFPKSIGAQHPYVSTNQYGTGNVCMGEMMTEIIKSYLILDWKSMGYWIDLWLTTYKCGVTGPLNNISHAIIGKPRILKDNGEDNSTAFYEVVGNPNSNNCWERVWNTLRRELDQGIVVLDTNESATNVIINQCDNISCTLREECKGYQSNTKGLKLRKDLLKFQKEECEFTTQFPSLQEEECDVYYYSDLLRDSLFVNNVYNIEFPFEHMEESFRNKAGIQGLKLLEHYLQEDLIHTEESDESSSLFIDALLNCKNNDMIWQEINTFFPRIPTEPLTEEQEEMASWAHAIRQQQ